MRKRFLSAALACLFLSGCGPAGEIGDNRPKAVATTTIVADALSRLSGGLVSVSALMGPGVDPHLYKASAGDVKKMAQADMVVYTGLELEGKMGRVLQNIKGKIVFAAAEDIDKSLLLNFEGGEVFDPHVWFDVSIWRLCVKRIAKGLKELDAENAAIYDENLKLYLEELSSLDEYISARAEELDVERRILVTAHDAFSYFGRRYGFVVRGLQGINTDAEAGTSDVSALADFIFQNKIKAIFLETLIPARNVEALRDAVSARGFSVNIGGELYTDSLGSTGGPAESYTGMLKENIDTIVGALK